jgi:hypothetical protein
LAPVQSGAVAGQWALTGAKDDLGTPLIGTEEERAKLGGASSTPPGFASMPQGFPSMPQGFTEFPGAMKERAKMSGSYGLFQSFTPSAERPNWATSVTTRLLSPPKTAQKIQVSGEFRFLVPSHDAAAKIVLPNFMGRPAGKVEAPALEGTGIEMQFEVKRGKSERASISPASRSGFQYVQFPGGEEFSKPRGEDKDTQVYLRFNGNPEAVFASVAFFDGDDKPIAQSSSLSSSNGEKSYHRYSFAKAPPANARMEIYWWTDKATVRVPFEVKDTQIP